MDSFQVTILGCGSAKPTTVHYPSSQIVNFRERLFMIDCGEGAQVQLMRYQFNVNHLTDIMISHMHGDHVLGLPGLVATLDLTNRDPANTLRVHVPSSGVKIVTEMLDYFTKYKSFEVKILPLLPGNNTIFESDNLKVTSFPLYHGVECYGFKFVEGPRPRKLLGDMLEFHDVPYYLRNSLKAGADFIKPNGTVIANSHLTTEGSRSASYAYCSDTRYDSRVVSAVKDVDVLYHEATYLDEFRIKARDRGHSTALEAATVAREAQVGKLVIGHYSKRYNDPTPLLNEALSVFPDSVAANEGLTIDLRR